MEETKGAVLEETEVVELPPSEDELPWDDGVPMESDQHRSQMNLLIRSLRLGWKDRKEGFVGGNMFIYFSEEQIRTRDFRGPDFFAVLGVPKRTRKSWVVWKENKGPDVVIELLSETTEAIDKGEKKRIYQDQLRVPEYFWYGLDNRELAGFRLLGGVYQPIKPDERGRLVSVMLNLALVLWEGNYDEIDGCWLRWANLAGLSWHAIASTEAIDARVNAPVNGPVYLLD
ncbi:MAG: Uma2 family endonuclease, partial [Nitrospira sp.]|nr:Uma2 family endonuclease [Nitrospira sp.]